MLLMDEMHIIQDIALWQTRMLCVHCWSLLVCLVQCITMYILYALLCDTPWWGAVIGFTNLGEDNTYVKLEKSAIHSKLRSAAATKELAKSLLVVMFKGLFAQCHSHSPVSLCSNQLFKPLWEVVSQLEQVGSGCMALHVMACQQTGTCPGCISLVVIQCTRCQTPLQEIDMISSFFDQPHLL